MGDIVTRGDEYKGTDFDATNFNEHWTSAAVSSATSKLQPGPTLLTERLQAMCIKYSVFFFFPLILSIKGPRIHSFKMTTSSDHIAKICI
jgi:hypothetical protein